MKRYPILVPAGLVLLLLAILFRAVLLPGVVLASNDAPLGLMKAFDDLRWDYFWNGSWANLTWLGNEAIGTMPNISHGSYVLLGAVGFAKFYAPISLFFLALSALYFCKRAGFQPWVGVLTAVAAAFNSNIFSHACWGLASRATVVASILFGLGVMMKRESGVRRWLQAALAGFAVGFGVMEGADVGAIFSLYAAAAILFHAVNGSQDRAKSLVAGLGQLALVVVCAAWIASYTVSSLIGTQVKGISGMAQDEATRKQRWDQATQWSWPKAESIRFLIPGVYGYRMDTPQGGNYWGSLGAPEGSPQSRFSGGGEYAGVLVLLIALWGIGRAFSKAAGQPFTPEERRWVFFWAIAALISLLLSFGRFAPFYRVIYALPYFSTIRNPIKFLHPFHMALLVLFAYGLQGLWRRHLETVVARKAGLVDQIRNWWIQAKGYDQSTRRGVLIIGALSLAGAILYGASRTSLVKHLGEVGFPGEAGTAVASFSIREVWLFVLTMTASLGALLIAFSGWFSGPRQQGAWLAIAAVLGLDMMRSNTPWVMTYDYTVRYQSNPVVEFLRQKPSEGRATAFLDPHRAYMLANNQVFGYLHNEWLEHHFQFNRIQSLDIIQMPRVPELDAAYLAALGPSRSDPNSLQRLWGAIVQYPLLPPEQSSQIRNFFPMARTNFAVSLRLWQLTNTRWLLGAAGLANTLNEAVDPLQKRFRESLRFEFAPKPDVQPSPFWPLQHVTAVESPTGSSAITEFTGALPRAKLYTQWEIVTNDTTHLARLLDPGFDPLERVLVFETPTANPTAQSSPGPSPEATVQDYRANKISVKTKATAPGVLLLNDRWDPNFRVTVNGKPASLLRCNHLMRGVEVPAGENMVEFRFEPSMRSLHISLAALVVALALCGILSRNPTDPH